MDKEQLVDLLVEHIEDGLNGYYTLLYVDEDKDLDSQWENCVLEALKVVKGNIELERGQDEPDKE